MSDMVFLTFKIYISSLVNNFKNIYIHITSEGKKQNHYKKGNFFYTRFVNCFNFNIWTEVNARNLRVHSHRTVIRYLTQLKVRLFREYPFRNR